MGTDTAAFHVTYPIYLIHVGEGDDVEVWGNTMQGHDFIVAFTDHDLAERFIKAAGEGQPLEVKDEAQFKEFLRRGSPTVVSFDPSIRGKQFDCKNNVFVKTLLTSR